MKKILLILLIVVILILGGFSYFYCNPQLPLSQKVLSMVGISKTNGEITQITNPASIFCKQNSGTLEIITDLSGGQSELCHLPNGSTCDEGAYFRGECPILVTEMTGLENTGMTSITPSGLQDSNNPMDIFLKDSSISLDNCSNKIGDIEQLKKDISIKTGGIIDVLSIKDACGNTRTYSSKMEDYKKTYKGTKDENNLENLIQENDKYIIYSLVDTNRDIYYIEYPVIVYDKQTKTNTLFTIRLNIPSFQYLDNEGNVIITLLNEQGYTRYIFNIPNNSILGEYHTPRLDCGDQSLSRKKGGEAVVLHRFEAGNCGYDYENRDLKKEKDIAGTLTLEKNTNEYTYSGIPLGTFTKTSKLHATNEDIMESIKGNTFIFHVDNTKYELLNNQLIKK